MRKRTAALLAALLQANLAPIAGARLAEAVLPVASKLLGVKPDSALHPGEEAAKVKNSTAMALPCIQAVGTRRMGSCWDHLLAVKGTCHMGAELHLCFAAASVPGSLLC